MYDTVIAGGSVVAPGGTQRADVAVSAGRIAALVPPGQRVKAAQTIEAQGCFVLPGLIDAHVHFRTPGLTHKEDWACGSRAAVAGGITTVIDMPNTVPPLLRPADAWAKHRAVDGTSLVDYRFHAGVGLDTIDSLGAFDRREAGSVKVFLSGHHTAHSVIRDEHQLSRVFEQAARHGLVLVCHSEREELVATQPRRAAIAATTGLIALARAIGARTHVLHVSSAEEVELLVDAARHGIPISFEVTGHHLTFIDDDVSQVGARLRLRPEIRRAADRERLWQAVLSGQAHTLGSDHAPHTVAEKERPGPGAPPGLPGVQELFLAVYTGMLGRGCSRSGALETVARLLAAAPARVFQLDHRKGSLAPGMDADLVVFDPEGFTALGPGNIYAKCGWSAYQDVKFAGHIRLTMRRGRPAYRRRGSRVAFGEPDGIWLSPAAV